MILAIPVWVNKDPHTNPNPLAMLPAMRAPVPTGTSVATGSSLIDSHVLTRDSQRYSITFSDLSNDTNIVFINIGTYKVINSIVYIPKKILFLNTYFFNLNIFTSN